MTRLDVLVPPSAAPTVRPTSMISAATTTESLTPEHPQPPPTRPLPDLPDEPVPFPLPADPPMPNPGDPISS